MRYKAKKDTESLKQSKYRYFIYAGREKCTNSETDRRDGLTAEMSGLIVRCCLGTVVNELLVEGAHLEPGAVSLLPHLPTHLQLHQSVDNKQA